jgi:serine protease Do
MLTILAAAVMAAAGPAPADPMADQARKARDAVVPSTVIVGFTVERDDGTKVDIRVFGTVVGAGNLVLFTSAAIPSQIAQSQFHDFKVIVAKGDDLQNLDAEYLGKDEQAQVAFLKVTDAKATDLPILAFDEKAVLEVADPLVSLSLLGEPDGYGRMVQVTRIAARIEQPSVTYVCESLGSLGSPVLTLDGKAVGIVGAVRINRGTNARPNWSVSEVLWPAERFLARIKNPPQGGTLVRRPWLGAISLVPVTKDLAEYYKLGDRRGVVVGQVVEGSPAAKAGILAEDIILAIGGKDLKGTEGQLVENFSNTIRECKIGETLVVEIWRKGKIEKLPVTLTEQPKTSAEAERYANTECGLTVREMVLGDRVARELPPTETGVVVAFLTPAGWADDSGLQAGDIIKKVQDQDTPALADFKRIFQDEVKKRPKEIVLFVLRGKNDTHVVRLEPRWGGEKPAAATDTSGKKPEPAPTPSGKAAPAPSDSKAAPALDSKAAPTGSGKPGVPPDSKVAPSATAPEKTAAKAGA